MQLLWLTILIAACTLKAAGQDEPHILCGRTLAKAHLLYCYGVEETRKRSMTSPLLEALNSYRESDNMVARARALVSLRTKRESGLADECCLKACYISELLNYC